jgi:hypothetical protein
MKHKECNQIRVEIDEAELGATLSGVALQHLRECGECQDFQNKQTKLRKIVGSLETVAAPADFDFRLRARLANGEQRSSYRFLSSFPVVRSPGFAVAVLILLVVGAFAFLRQFAPREQMKTDHQASMEHNPAPVKAAEGTAGNTEQPPSQIDPRTAESLAGSSSRTDRRVVAASPVQRRPAVAVDLGSTEAPVIRNSQSIAGVTTFPLDVPHESFKVSIDDGRGTSRTISLPSVSFGSRRVLTGRNISNQFAPNGAW